MEQGTGAPGETVPARIAADRVRGISSRETLWIAFTVSPSQTAVFPHDVPTSLSLDTYPI